MSSVVLPNVSRAALVAEELNRRLYKDAKLEDLPPWIVINATNLMTGKGWKFFRDRAGDYLIGATGGARDLALAEAVGASAAYPLFVDPYSFRTRWEDLQYELLDERWGFTDGRGATRANRWRARFGRLSGDVEIPLADGGIYDNEGVNSLRSGGIDYAVISSSAQAPDGFFRTHGVGAVRRAVDVAHSRLGDVSRQHAFEMTHGENPTEVRRWLLESADDLDSLAETMNSSTEKLGEIAQRLRRAARVGWPPRGHQFRACAFSLLHTTDLARNRSATFEENPYDVEPPHRGLDPVIVEELCRVRTDLDALSELTFRLLVSQGYFLTDWSLRVAMPELETVQDLVSLPIRLHRRPEWGLALDAVRHANENIRDTAAQLVRERQRKLLGRPEQRSGQLGVRR